jgi:glycosyltransferase involved in cell wall biosynthesis
MESSMSNPFFTTVASSISVNAAETTGGVGSLSEAPAIAVSERGYRDVEIALLCEAGGGVLRHVLDLHRGLIRHGRRATLILSPKRMDDRYRDEIYALDKEQVVFVEMERAPHPSDITAYLGVRSALKKMRRCRILHAHSTKAGLLGTLLYPETTAMLYTPHCYRATDPSLAPLIRRTLRSVEMAYSRPYDRIIAVSSSEREYVLDCGVDPNRVTCISNGIEYAGKASGADRTHRMRSSNTITMGFVGRLAHQKNPLLFIDTLALLVQRGYDVKAIIVGDGDLKQEMMSQAEHLNVASRIDWKGEISAREALSDMDVMVHTSYYEALPYTLLEACSALLPIVATNNHGSRAVLQGELAENIVAEATAEALGNRMLQLIHDPSLWSHQLDLLDQAAQAFSLETMVTRIEQIYLDLLSERSELTRSLERYMMPSVSRIQALF